MARRTVIDTFKLDNLLLDFMRERKGEENCVSSREIHKFLSEKGYSCKWECVNSMITRIMYERNAPICSLNRKGYFWAKNRTEIENTISSLESRRSALQEHIDHLRNFIID